MRVAPVQVQEVGYEGWQRGRFLQQNRISRGRGNSDVTLAAGRSRHQALVAACEGTAGRLPDCAVVIGAGLAGLTAARALSAHFQSVTILERDRWNGDLPGASAARRGVPQFQQPHVLLGRGLKALDSLLGDFSGALQQAGGFPLCWTLDFYYFDYNRSFTRGETDIRGVLSTRALAEQTVRSLVLDQQGVTLRSGAFVSGLVFNTVEGEGRRRVTGVRLKDGSTLEAGLVVDASGRSSQTPSWLAAGGCQRPPELVVDAKLGYATRLYARPAGYVGPSGALIRRRPLSSRAAALVPVEGGCWQLILGGYADDQPPTDEEGFAAFLQSFPKIASMLEGAEPLSSVVKYLGTRNQRRLYEEVDMPDGLVVLGDAVCSFNPLFGQGISVGVMESEVLRQLLDERVSAAGGNLRAALSGLPNAFQRRVAEVVRLPWQLAIGEDTKIPTVQANFEVPQRTQLLRSYVAAVATAASQDVTVLKQYVKVLHMLSPPSTFFSPFIMARAAWYAVLLPWLARQPLVHPWLTEGQAGNLGPAAKHTSTDEGAGLRKTS